MAHWDIAVHGGFHELVTIAGRTAAGPGNSFAHDLLVVKDEGVFLYNPGTERERLVEIQGPDDYDKILRWYREGTTQILDHRPDLDWATRVPGAPNASLFGPYQFNLNRDGQTWFIPITDIGWLYFSVMLNIFDAWHIYFVDDRTGEPAGSARGSRKASSSSRSRSASGTSSSSRSRPTRPDRWSRTCAWPPRRWASATGSSAATSTTC